MPLHETLIHMLITQDIEDERYKLCHALVLRLLGKVRIADLTEEDAKDLFTVAGVVCEKKPTTDFDDRY